MKKNGFVVKEVSIPSKGVERGSHGNFFSATVIRGDGSSLELYLGWKSVRQALDNIRNERWSKL